MKNKHKNMPIHRYKSSYSKKNFLLLQLVIKDNFINENKVFTHTAS